MSDKFQEELETLINKHSMESGSDTPDWILAQYIQNSLDTFNKAVRARDRWYNRASFRDERMNLE